MFLGRMTGRRGVRNGPAGRSRLSLKCQSDQSSSAAVTGDSSFITVQEIKVSPLCSQRGLQDFHCICMLLRGWPVLPYCLTGVHPAEGRCRLKPSSRPGVNARRARLIERSVFRTAGCGGVAGTDAVNDHLRPILQGSLPPQVLVLALAEKVAKVAETTFISYSSPIDIQLFY